MTRFGLFQTKNLAKSKRLILEQSDESAEAIIAARDNTQTVKQRQQ